MIQLTVDTAQAVKALRAFPRELDKAIRLPMNQARKMAGAEARREFKTRNPGRGIFSFRGGRGRPPLKVSGRAARLSQSQGGYVAQMIIEGMAALIEEGGKTKPPRKHGGLILPVRKKALRFDGRGTVFAASVQHPGSRVPKNPIGQRAMERAGRALPQMMDASIQAAAKAVGL